MTSLELEEPVRITRLRAKTLRVPQPQYQIAALAGIHPSTFSLYITGQRPIKDKHLVALCDLFRCEPEEILGWEEPDVS
jgi:DNA-binding Xre family transcriptional regulator